VSYDGTYFLKNLVATTSTRKAPKTSSLKNLISQPKQPQEPYKDNQACITEENPLLAECLLVYPVFDERDITHHPFHFATMQHYQQRSDATKQLLID
jgi:hypothetical protein